MDPEDPEDPEWEEVIQHATRLLQLHEEALAALERMPLRIQVSGKDLDDLLDELSSLDPKEFTKELLQIIT